MELNKIEQKLDKKEYDFFYRFQQQLELPLYFIGSINRSDFMKGKSDLDIEVFSENVTSTKYQIEYLFDYYKKKDPKYIVFKIHGTPISGYKYYLKNTGIFFDFTIYKKESQEIVLHQRKIENDIPLVLIIFLIVIKYLYYYLYIINSTQYSFIKKKFWSLYNIEKTVSTTYDTEGYSHYVHSETGDKSYLL